MTNGTNFPIVDDNDVPRASSYGAHHYESMPIQIYWEFYHPKIETFLIKIRIFFIFLLKT